MQELIINGKIKIQINKQQEFIDRLLEQMEKNSNIDQAKVMI